MFHICRTIWRHFSLRQVKLCIGQRNYKQKFTTQGSTDRPIDRPSEWIRPHSLNSYFAFCKIVVINTSRNYSWPEITKLRDDSPGRGCVTVCNSSCFSSTFYTNYYAISLRAARVNACRRLVCITSKVALYSVILALGFNNMMNAMHEYRAK